MSSSSTTTPSTLELSYAPSLTLFQIIHALLTTALIITVGKLVISLRKINFSTTAKAEKPYTAADYCSDSMHGVWNMREMLEEKFSDVSALSLSLSLSVMPCQAFQGRGEGILMLRVTHRPEASTLISYTTFCSDP